MTANAHRAVAHPSSTLAEPRPLVAPMGPVHWRQFVHALLASKAITREEADRVTQRCAQAESSQHPLIRLSALSVQAAGDGHVMDIEELTRHLAIWAELDYRRVDPLKVDAAKVSEVMGASYAERHHILPLSVSPTEVVVGVQEPFITDWVQELERQTKRSVRRVVVSPTEIRRYIGEFFALAKSVRAAVKAGGNTSSASFEQLVELGSGNKQLDANDQGVVQVVDWLWQYAFEQRASDIHLEPRRDQGAIRFRIDGVLHRVYQMPIGVLNAMIARVKLLGRMDVVERRRPQDGRVKTRNPMGSEVEMRLSTLPTAFGEKLVMRIFDPDNAVKSLGELGFSAEEAARWETLTSRPHGIILVTGPTGSGKTTTLYATLKRLATEEVNVSTVEDPIEMIEPAFNQTQVQPQLDFSFAEGLRALMRQDPDIIMVGEIRDLETADMAVQSALTGHLVFSTLHTNDAPSAVTRLMELGVPPYLINATVLGVLAQRLVRTLCANCKAPDEAASPDDLIEAIKPWTINRGNYRPYKPVGCVECRMTGYRGRKGLYELLALSEDFKHLINKEPSLEKLRRQGARDGMRPLRLAGAIAVSEGMTTLEEVVAATPPLH